MEPNFAPLPATLLPAVAPLFSGWQETLLYSCLEGRMGHAYAIGQPPFSAAQMIVGDFCFFAGVPNEALVRHFPAQRTAPLLMAARTPDWEGLIEAAWPGCEKFTRYATQKTTAGFEHEKLLAYTQTLPAGCRLVPIGEALYQAALLQPWSRDLVSQFATYADYARDGLGVMALCDGQPVSGASSYTSWSGGIEIEIDTHPDYRRRGLARACGAQLMLNCLARGGYPSWDAHDLRSLSLAKTLGYLPAEPYVTYCVSPA